MTGPETSPNRPLPPSADGPRSEEELLAHEELRARYELRHAVESLRRDAGRAIDLRRRLRERPLLYLGSAAACGLIAARPLRRLLALNAGRGVFLSLVALAARYGALRSLPDLFADFSPPSGMSSRRPPASTSARAPWPDARRYDTP